MIHFKPGAIILSLTFHFVVSTAGQKTSRDAAQIGYLYDKPGRTLEEPKEDTSFEDVNYTRIPTERPSEEYLPPKARSLTYHFGGEEDRFRRLNDKKRDLEKTKGKSTKHHRHTYFQGYGDEGFKQKNGFKLENKKE